MLVLAGLPSLVCTNGKASSPCIKMDPPRRWKGLWFDEFEGSRFCPAPAKECSEDTPGDRIAIDWVTKFPPELKARVTRNYYNGVYAVDFIGQRTSVRGGYGRYNYRIAGQRLISLTEVAVRRRD